jgi:hypothetical protein
VKNSPIPDEVKPNWTHPTKKDRQKPCDPAGDSGGNRACSWHKCTGYHRDENEKRHRDNEEEQANPDALSTTLQHQVTI